MMASNLAKDMNVKKFTSTALFISTLCFALPAQASAEEYEFSGTISQETISQYLGTNGAVFHPDPVSQVDLWINLPKDWYVDLWWSAGFDNESNFGDEIDWTAGKVFNLGDTSIDAGVSFFDTHDLFSSGGAIGDVVRPYVRFNRNVTKNVGIYLDVERYIPLREGIQGGINFIAGIKHSFEVSQNTNLWQNVSVRYDDGSFGFDEGLIGFYKAGLDWEINDSSTLTFPTIRASTPLSAMDDSRKAELALGAKFTRSF